METEKKSKRGGYRPGAGAKKKYVRRYVFSATEKAAMLIEQAENKTEFINRCVEMALETEET